MRGVELVDVDIDGEIQDVRINGVDVRSPDRGRSSTGATPTAT